MNVMCTIEIIQMKIAIKGVLNNNVFDFVFIYKIEYKSEENNNVLQTVKYTQISETCG